ncbi:AtpZ/AtpI family protein [Actinoplanes utahensis]|uniref:Uncharacterized protein n=1 Tax=Actinoplanes utahensis TaxID=1869 RepID=A0A0A6URM9_ACTUT|nr:hypothetical protein [Actinoplanes utahensis]KHD77114.1 hypothetical protein MB27_13520 [Actinoplanes utahensis]GIF33016.1 hypothetical protein Aut01nite_60020 [Actinoplanes utahensis]
MTGQKPPHESRGDDNQNRPPDTGAGMTALSYLIAGILAWGGIGWLIDYFVGTTGIFAGLGAVLGVAGAVYIIVRRSGA